MVYKNNIDPVQKRFWPGTKAILTQYKSDADPVQKRYWPGTKAIPFDTVYSTVTQLVCTGSTGTCYKSGTGIRYRNVYRNGVQDVYRKVPYRYLVPYTTIPNRYHLPPLNSTGTGTDRYRNVYWDTKTVWFTLSPYRGYNWNQSEWCGKTPVWTEPHQGIRARQVSSRILKELAKGLEPVLAKIYEQSLKTGQLPSDWLKADITPV